MISVFLNLSNSDIFPFYWQLLSKDGRIFCKPTLSKVVGALQQVFGSAWQTVLSLCTIPISQPEFFSFLFLEKDNLDSMQLWTSQMPMKPSTYFFIRQGNSINEKVLRRYQNYKKTRQKVNSQKLKLGHVINQTTPTPKV